MTKKGKLSPHTSPISGHSPRRDIRCLLALAGWYNPLARLPFGGLPSVIMRHCETAEQGSRLISYSFRYVSLILHPHRQAHHRVSMAEEVYTEKADRLELWVFLPCLEDPGEAPKMIAYAVSSGRCHQIHGLQRRFNSRTKDSLSHSEPCVDFI